LVDAGGQESKQAVIHRVLPRIESELVEEDREHVATGETRIENSIAWARDALVKTKLMERTPRDVWRISDLGREWLAKNPKPLKREIRNPLGGDF